MNESLWKPDDMLEVGLKEPDDFLKVRETLSRIRSHLVRTEHYFNRVISYTNKVNTLSCISKNYLH